MTTGIIIQCHDKSTRLPKKLFKELGDMTILEHVICTCCMSIADIVIVAVSTDSANDDLILLVKTFLDKYPKLQLYKYHGDDNDVLARYYNAAKDNQLSIIVRITSDCYNHDSHIINTCLKVFNIKQPDFLDFLSVNGWDTQIIPFETLEKIYKEATEKHQLEHVFPYLYENKNKFKIMHLEDIKMSIDTENDYEFAKKLY